RRKCPTTKNPWQRPAILQNDKVMEFNGNRRGIVFIGLLIVAATLAVYWPVRHYDFVDYDDDSYVFENPDVTHGLSWGGVKWAFVDRHSSNWHPITWLSHMADCQWFGLNAGPAHLENVILHGASALLLLVLLAAITGAPWRSALVAALFALHPLRVESVAWISERKDVLATLFWMATMVLYVRWVERPTRARWATVLVAYAA